MEGDNGGGREAPVQKKGKEFYANTDREIDQHELAALLRKSADIVERGEFGSVLYEALQDFRVYYKQKYPKNAKKKKAKKEQSERGTRTAPIDLTEEKSAAGSTKILDDLKQSEKKISKDTGGGDSKEAKANATSTPEQEEKKSDPDNGEDKSVPSGGVSVDAYLKPERTNDQDTAVAATTAAAIGTSTRSASSEGKVDDTTPPLVSEETLPKDADDDENTADASELSPTPSGGASIPVDSAAPIPEYYSNSDTSSSIFKNNQKNKFGKKFKLGTTFENVKKAAKNAKKNMKENMQLDKKISSKARDDIEYFAESGMDMAESSNRRTQAYEGKDSGFQSRVTGGMAGAGVVGSSKTEQNNEFVGNESHINHHGRPGRDGDFGQSDTSYPAFAQPPVTNNAEKQGSPGRFGFSPRHQPAGYSFYQGEEGENGDLDQPELNHASAGIRKTNSEASAEEESSNMGSESNRPKFQRPDNTSSQLVVSGWIEQFRRSKMRLVWKEVLASLVEGQKPGEVTTLWIQREIVDPLTGQKELEALHRIPMQILEDASLTEQTSDSQFRLKLHNHTEEFVFRCDGAPNDSLRWVQILKKYAKLTREKMRNGNTQPPPQVPSTKGMPIRDLRAICHGAGINTTGMERSQLEAAAEDVQRRGTYFDQRGAPTGPSTQHPPQQYAPPQQNQANPDESAPPPPTPPPTPPRMSIKELRAICHGAGIKTVGMERRDLEAAAQEVQNRGTYFPPTRTQEDDETRARREELRRQNQQKEEMQRRKEAEERHRREVEASRARAFAEQEARRRAAEEEARRRAYEEEQRRRAAAEEARRRAAAEEQMRRQREAHEAQQRYAQQQAAWQQQQRAEEQRRRAAEQQAAAEHRQREEARRKEQQWSTPAPGAHPQHQAHQYHHQQQQRYPQQQWQKQPQQQPHQQQHRPPPPQQQHHAPPPPQQQQRQHSGTDNKYAKMASQSEDDGQAAITKIKHSILIQWALQPPQLQCLRPIAALVTTIHAVFPPALGVSGHEYFKKWKPITREDLAGANGLPEEAKLKKSVRKIRFFLHPDKLPHDLDEEQKFTVKMLWDITNDSWEEYQKHKDDLDWVN